jgi:4-methyl-5(b-hydroxyethyl)-thiazole monophosphate biosynthesis
MLYYFPKGGVRMAKAALFLIDGFEETEAVATVDILRRGEVQVTTVSLTGREMVNGKHGIQIKADALFEDVRCWEFDMLVIPGGTTDYTKHEGLLDLVRRYHGEQKRLAAICAAPAVFGAAGILSGKRAVCYPGMESWLTGAVIGDGIVETDGHITTSRGPATAVFFALALVEILNGADVAKKVGDALLVPRSGHVGQGNSAGMPA